MFCYLSVWMTTYFNLMWKVPDWEVRHDSKMASKRINVGEKDHAQHMLVCCIEVGTIQSRFSLVVYGSAVRWRNDRFISHELSSHDGYGKQRKMYHWISCFVRGTVWVHHRCWSFLMSALRTCFRIFPPLLMYSLSLSELSSCILLFESADDSMFRTSSFEQCF